MSVEAQAVVDLARSLYERGLTPGTSGNLSVLTGSGMLITPTSSCLGRLRADGLAHLDRNGEHIAGGVPSKELPLHLAVYRHRPDARAVVHLHSPWAVAVSCLASTDPDDAIPALTGYHALRVGRVPLVPYHRPGSSELAAAVAERAGTAHALLLANHGSIVAATDLESAADAAEQLEQTAQCCVLLSGRQVRFVQTGDTTDAELAGPVTMLGEQR